MKKLGKPVCKVQKIKDRVVEHDKPTTVRGSFTMKRTMERD